MENVRHLAIPICVLFVILATAVASAQERGIAHDPPVAAEQEHASGSAEEEKVPEIEVEVIGKKWGEQSVPSLSPSTAEVISVIPSEEIEAVGETTLADTIQFLPGVHIVRQGRKFERLVYVRGTFVPTVLLDGAQISAATTGFMSGFANRALYSIPLSAVERIEVIRSSSSMIYGPQALTGGVINIVTKSGEGPSQIEMNAENGSYDNWRYSVGHFEGDHTRGSAFVAEQETGDTNLEWGGRRMNHLFYKADRTFDNGDTLKLFLLSNEGKRRIDSWSEEYQAITGRPPVYWTFDPWRERFTSLAYAHKLADPDAGVDLLLWARNRYFRQWWFDGPIGPRPGQTVYQDTKDDTIGASLFWRQPVADDHFLRMGVQWFRLNGYDKDAELDPVTLMTTELPPLSTDSKLTSYVFQDEWTLAPATRFYYGGRYEVPDDRDNAFVYALGLERDLSEETNVYARFGTGVEYPTDVQLENDPTLEDRTSQNWDVGLDHYFGPNLVGRIGWFQAEIQNEFIDYLRPGGDPSNRGDYRTTQADQTTSGYELELQGGKPSLRWFTNYAILDRTVSRTPVIGDQPLQLGEPPDNMVNLGLRWLPHDRTRVSFTHKYVSDYLAWARYFAGAYPMEGYQVANLTVSQQLGEGWSLKAAVSNIFDKDYETQPGFPMPGRNYLVGLTRTVETD